MTPERWRRITEVSHLAQLRDGDARASFLEEACAGDLELRAEVERLLAALGESGGSGEPSVSTAALGKMFLPAPGLEPVVHPDASREFLGNSRFERIARIGAGGMGIVYKVLDREQGRCLALKTMSAPSPATTLRFKNEFRALHDLHHPNLIQLGEVFEEEGFWFFTMELVEGVDFLRHVRPLDSDGPGKGAPSDVSTQVDASHRPAGPGFEEGRLRASLLQLFQGVLAIHRFGKVHHDIKPSNCLVSQEGRLVLLDFGLASDILPLSAEARSMSLIGTPAYMAPEQFSVVSVGPEVDWYAAGVMLYEALTGRHPYLGPLNQVIEEKRTRAPVAPRSIVPSVPLDLDAICMDLLQIDPTARLKGEEALERLSSQAKAHGSQRIAEDDAHHSIVLTHAGPFIGREHELAVLEKAWADASHGRAATVLISGVSGIGKTALVRHFVARRLSEPVPILVLPGRCYEREAVPFKAWDEIIDLLTNHLRRLPGTALSRLLPSLKPLAHSFPVLRSVPAVQTMALRPTETLDPHEQRNQVFQAFRSLLRTLAARQPLLVVIDDLQWADADSLALLRELVRPPDAPGFVLIASHQTPSQMAAEELERSLRLPVPLLHLEVEALPAERSRELVQRLLQERGLQDRRRTAEPEASADDIARDASGHPLFIAELVRHGLEIGGRGATAHLKLDDAIWNRVCRLEPAARSLLDTVAVAGIPLAQDVVIQASNLPESARGEHIVWLRNANLVRTHGIHKSDRIEPYHDRVREVVLDHMAPETRIGRHRALATALEQSGHFDAEVLCVHWQGAGEHRRAATLALLAAEEAERALAFDRAARQYGLAIELRSSVGEPHGDLYSKQGAAFANAGRGFEAANAFLLASDGQAGDQASELRRRAAQQLLVTGHIERGVELLRSVLDETGLSYPHSLIRASASVLFLRARLAFRGLRFDERDESSLSAGELRRIDLCFHASLGLGMSDRIRGYSFHSRGLLLALQAGEPYRLSRAFASEAAYLSSEGGAKAAGVEQNLERAARLAGKVRNPHAQAFHLVVCAHTAYCLGRFASSLEFAREAEARLRERCTAVPWELATARLWYARSLQWLGRFAELAERLPRLLVDCSARGDLYAEASLRGGISPFVCLAAGDVAAARVEARDSRERWSARGFHIQHFYALFSEVSIALYAGDAGVARRLLLGGWEEAERSLLMRVQILRVQMVDVRGRAALLASATAGDSEKRALIQEAERCAKQLVREKMPWSTPLGWCLLAGCHAARSRQEEAVQQYLRAVHGFEASDLRLHASAARRRLGQLLGGRRGDEYVRSADAWMEKEIIREPGRWARMFAP